VRITWKILAQEDDTDSRYSKGKSDAILETVLRLEDRLSRIGELLVRRSISVH
jgi:hypothetical protein